MIEEEHYNKLIELINQFEQFQFGKQRLVEIRIHYNKEQTPSISKEDTREVIVQNQKTKENYDNLIMDIGKSFRNQIKG